ncbi:MAG: hypothetical protein AAF628_32835 [Planctomycetota bacterium]
MRALSSPRQSPAVGANVAARATAAVTLARKHAGHAAAGTGTGTGIGTATATASGTGPEVGTGIATATGSATATGTGIATATGSAGAAVTKTKTSPRAGRTTAGPAGRRRKPAIAATTSAARALGDRVAGIAMPTTHHAAAGAGVPPTSR